MGVKKTLLFFFFIRSRNSLVQTPAYECISYFSSSLNQKINNLHIHISLKTLV